MRLYDLARVMRSKNAGPFTLTIDLMFARREDFGRALGSAALTAERIGELYGVDPAAVRIMPFERVLTVKVSMPRPGPSSGAPGDRDVYGSQQHFPLGALDV
ncbi:MAG TPA: DUF4387 domain-containing protein [Armatimonadota bacterium]|nr:DUF4387 domain-containing protein [Armatimonadota bacterium]